MVIDSDVIIRFFTNDDKKKAARFRKFLMSKKKGYVSDVTVAEIYWTLKLFYRYSKEKIIELIESLIESSSIKCNRKVLRECLRILREKNISFIDAHTAAWSSIKDDGKILSFDRDFDKFSLVKRVEP